MDSIAFWNSNNFWGSYLMTSDGVILNDEMGDFSSPGEINDFGFSASPANYIVCIILFLDISSSLICTYNFRLAENGHSHQLLPRSQRIWRRAISLLRQEVQVAVEVRRSATRSPTSSRSSLVV